MNRAPSMISNHHACSNKDRYNIRLPVKPPMTFDSSRIRGARIVLYVSNSVVFILSVAMIGLSASMYRAGVTAKDTRVITLLEEMTVSNEISIGTVIEKISIGILVVGIFTVMSSLFGIFGTFYKSKPMFIVYPFFVVPILGFVIFVMVLWFKLKDKVSYTAKNKMLEMLKIYQGKRQIGLTKAWNNLFLWFDCCGVNAQSEMDDFLVSKWNTSTRGNQIVPAFCCRGATAATVLEYDATNCTTSPTSTTAYINMGCYKAILNYLHSYSDGFIAISFLLLFALFTATTLGLVIVCKTTHRRKKLHTPIHEKSIPGTLHSPIHDKSIPIVCSEHNTTLATGPASVITTLDEGRRPFRDHPRFGFARGFPDFPFHSEYPIYNFNPDLPMSRQVIELLFDCWGRPYYMCNDSLDLEEKPRNTHRNKDQDRDEPAKFDDHVRVDVYLNRDNRGLSSRFINFPYDYPTMATDNLRDRRRIAMGHNRFHEDVARKFRPIHEDAARKLPQQ